MVAAPLTNVYSIGKPVSVPVVSNATAFRRRTIGFPLIVRFGTAGKVML